jgi:hypothetical protein
MDRKLVGLRLNSRMQRTLALRARAADPPCRYAEGLLDELAVPYR